MAALHTQSSIHNFVTNKRDEEYTLVYTLTLLLSGKLGRQVQAQNKVRHHVRSPCVATTRINSIYFLRVYKIRIMRDTFTKKWIIEHAIVIVERYEKGVLTLRSLHYQLFSEGMTNDLQHYKRVLTAMIYARWEGLIDFDQFSDLDRVMVGETAWKETVVEDEIYTAQRQVRAWMTNYHKNKWENQPWYPEVFIEKKALQGVFQDVCEEWNIALGACKGYPSLTFLNEAFLRVQEAERSGKQPIILYFGDYDPYGEDIPRSIQENIARFGVDIEVRRIALMEDQVIEWKLPPAPAKVGDSRTANWDGLGQVELDAVRPEKLMDLLKEAISSIFDNELYEELMEKEEEERTQYQKELKQFVIDIKD